MSQSDFGNLESPLPGSTFFNSKLEPWRDALHSLHKGSTRPSYATAGMMWIDDSANPWLLYVFDGTNDILLGTINISTNIFTPANIGIADGDYGDINVSGGVWTVESGSIGTGKMAAGAATYAKIQNVSAASRILGRKTSGAGVIEELTLSDLLDFIGSAAQGDILYRGASGWARLTAGTNGQFLKTQGVGANLAWGDAAGLSVAANYLYVRDEKTANTAGGTSTTGTQTRTLNTVVSNTISGASLSSNQIVLPAGSYYAKARAPSGNANNAKLRLRNVTDSAYAAEGASSYSAYGQVDQVLTGRFTIAGSKTFELHHYISSGLANTGLGDKANQGTEIYAELEIWKYA